MKLINRGILIVKPNQNFLDWLNQLPDTEPDVSPFTLDDVRQDCTAFLLPDVVSEGSVDFILEPIKTNLFEMELADWCTDPSQWPVNRSPEMFDLWFDIEFHTMVWDLLELPIQAMDEDQDFDPLLDEYPEDETPKEILKDDFEPDIPFKRQDSVIVHVGTTEPNHTHNRLDGWQGRIIDFIEGEKGCVMALVEWDSFTLEQMPDSYIRERADHSWDWEALALDVKVLAPIRPRDNYHRVERVQSRLSAKYFWPLIPSAGERIAEFLSALNPADDRSIFAAWEESLAEKLSFPFQACVERSSPGNQVTKGDFVTVQSIAPFDPLTGVQIQAAHRTQIITVPLANLIVLNESSFNHQATEDYKLWFDYTL
jgi:hypothetical protein